MSDEEKYKLTKLHISSVYGQTVEKECNCEFIIKQKSGPYIQCDTFAFNDYRIAHAIGNLILGLRSDDSMIHHMEIFDHDGTRLQSKDN